MKVLKLLGQNRRINCIANRCKWRFGQQSFFRPRKIRGDLNHAPNNRLFLSTFSASSVKSNNDIHSVSTVEWEWPGRYNMELELDSFNTMYRALGARCHHIFSCFYFSIRNNKKKWTHAESGQCWTTDDIRAHTTHRRFTLTFAQFLGLQLCVCMCLGPVYCRFGKVFQQI